MVSEIKVSVLILDNLVSKKVFISVWENWVSKKVSVLVLETLVSKRKIKITRKELDQVNNENLLFEF